MPKPMSKKKGQQREIIYPKPTVEVSKISVNRAKELLGWMVETEEDKFGTDYLLIDEEGHKIRCTNNDHNRPFNEGWSRTIAQDILNKHFRFNGESVIIGQTGRVLSAQHRLIGLVLAGQIQASPAQKYHWETKWGKEEVFIESAIVYGIDESDDVTRTLDNVRPRSFGDVVYLSDTFKGTKAEDKKKASKMLEHAARMLWVRTGCGDKDLNPFSPRITLSSLGDFVGRHPRLVKCVRHVLEEEGGKEKRISKYVPPGYMAALMYLMGCSNTDGDFYRNMPIPGENTKKFDWTLWYRAEEFVVALAQEVDELKEVKSARRPSDGGEYSGFIFADGEGRGSVLERMSVICKAWQAFKENEKVRPADLELEYHVTKDDDGVIVASIMVENVTVGGIDLGENANESDSGEETVAEPTPEEIAAKAEEARQAREEKKAKLLANRAAKNGKPEEAPVDAPTDTMDLDEVPESV